MLMGYSVTGIYIDCSYGPRWADSGCLGNHVSLPVPATTSGGPGGDTGKESVCLGRSKRAVLVLCVRRICVMIVRLLLNVVYMFDMDIRK